MLPIKVNTNSKPNPIDPNPNSNPKQ